MLIIQNYNNGLHYVKKKYYILLNYIINKKKIIK